ncbi:Lipase 3 precursor [compost metagenome]
MIWTESGKKGEEALVFLHGAGLSARQWEPQLSALGEFHSLAPDLPGNGRSPGPIDLERTADAIAEAIRARVPGGKASLVGNSFGGSVALTVLHRHAACVSRVLVSGTSAPLGSGLAWVMEQSGALYRFIDPEKLVASGLKQFRIPPSFHDAFREDMRRVMNPEANQQVVAALRAFVIPRDVQIPVLVAVGSLETLPAKRSAKQLAQAIPKARGVLVSGVGHVWNLEAPERFNALVRAWASDETAGGEALPEGMRPLG